MIVPRHAHGLRQALIMDRRLQHHALVELRHHLALDLLPWRLALGIVIAAVLGERGAALSEFGVRDQDVRGALLEIDPHPVAGLDERKTPSRRRLWRSVEDRGRPRSAGLPAV